ncbi:hypothetical protein JYU34_002871 [Plutella xylostella]|uniref:Uncharacterized protein n=1 Tax=Plutella xylostella TaxID=51655 RepID=A0ABQ7R3D3_PLUXY|nr:hypothetical protein JYU34_002871 [Plutella xylostella]
MKKTTDKENLQKKRQTKRNKKETESEDSSPQEENAECACIYCGSEAETKRFHKSNPVINVSSDTAPC